MNLSRRIFSQSIVIFNTKRFFADQKVIKNPSLIQFAKKLEIQRPSSISFQSKFLSNGPAKKRQLRKKWPEDKPSENDFGVAAFATAEEYDLEKLLKGIMEQNLYVPKQLIKTDTYEDDPDVLYVSAKYQVGHEPRDIFFFREGTCVLWNISDLESSNVLKFLKEFEHKSYDETVVQGESELMNYTYSKEDSIQNHLKRGVFYLNQEEDNYMKKYTFSNAMSLSVKLGVWENALENYIDSVEFITEDLKRGKKINLSRAEALKKTGELYALRRLINLSSDLLDTPDFYWDHEHLEQLYAQTCRYFSIPRRTHVINEKLNHCIELADLVSSNLNEIHNVRLEWMIIILIMVEVVFEFIHYAERYSGKEEIHAQVEQ